MIYGMWILTDSFSQKEAELSAVGVQTIKEVTTDSTAETESLTEAEDPVETESVSETKNAAEEAPEETSESVSETETAQEAEEPKLRVILDAGHGGNDGGTSSGKMIEKTINLDITKRVKTLLEAEGIEIVMTREEDEYLGLDERAMIANQAGGDLFLSIHCNYYKEGSPISGVECYYYSKAKEGKECAEKIIDSLKANGKVEARKEQDYYVLKNTSMTAVLIEVGYLSSSKDRQNLGSQNYKDTMARELVAGVMQYLQETATAESEESTEVESKETSVE